MFHKQTHILSLISVIHHSDKLSYYSCLLFVFSSIFSYKSTYMMEIDRKIMYAGSFFQQNIHILIKNWWIPLIIIVYWVNTHASSLSFVLIVIRNHVLWNANFYYFLIYLQERTSRYRKTRKTMCVRYCCVMSRVPK